MLGYILITVRTRRSDCGKAKSPDKRRKTVRADARDLGWKSFCSGTIFCDHLIKYPRLSPMKQGPLELSSHSPPTTLEDIIITESSGKHMPQCCTNNSAEMGQLVAKRFYSLTNVVPVTEWEYIYSDRLPVHHIHRFRVTTEPHHNHVWSLRKYQLYTNSGVPLSQSNMQFSAK